jgi:hypothetical protein
MPAVVTSPTPITVADIATRVKRIFGDESGALIDDDDILRWANDAQLDIARKTHCLVKTEYYNSGVGTYQLGLPAGFLFFQRATFDGRLLSSISYQELDSRYPERGASYPSSTPEYLTFVGSAIELFPAPSTVGSNNIVITYIARPATLVADGDVLEIPDQYYEAILNFCLMRAKEQDQDWSASNIYRDKFETELSEIRADVALPVQTTYPVVRDDDGDDW